MRKLFSMAAAVAALIFASVGIALAQTGPSVLSRVGGMYIASNYNYGQGLVKVISGNAAAGSATIIVYPAQISLPDGRQLQPFNATTPGPITIDLGANAETVTPTAISIAACPSGALTQQQCASITATFANAHGIGASVVSGSFGLQEAINDANGAGGGMVVVDSTFAGSTATLTARTSFAKVGVMDLRGSTAGGPVYYVPSGTTYAQAANPSVLPVLSSGAITPVASAAAIGVNTQTFTVTGVASGDTLAMVSAPAPTALCPLVSARATALNTVSLDWAVLTAAACTPAAGTYKFQIVR